LLPKEHLKYFIFLQEFKNQLHPKAGENLGSGDENKKLTLKYF